MESCPNLGQWTSLVYSCSSTEIFFSFLVCHGRKVKLAWTCGNRLILRSVLPFLRHLFSSIFWTTFVWQVRKITRLGGGRGRFLKTEVQRGAAIWGLKLGWKTHSLQLYLAIIESLKQSGFNLNQEAAIKFIFLRNTLLVHNIALNACFSQLTWRRVYFTMNLFHFIGYISF